MSYTYDQTKQGYINLWLKSVIRSQYLAASRTWADKITANKAAYMPVQLQTGVPWFFVGLLHMRESGLNLETYLGNGQSLHQVTTAVPAGRGPFTSFAAGAIDALTLQGFTKIKDWPVSRILWAAEVFNGQGYFARGINSPYNWSYTNLYTSGKFTNDGVYDSSAVDSQCGVASALGSLIVSNPEVAQYLAAYNEEMIATVPSPANPPVPPVTPATPTVTIVTTGGVTVVVNGVAINPTS